MSDAALYAVLSRLNVQLHALAALGAEMALRQSGEAGDPTIRPLLQAVADGLQPGLLDGLAPGEEGAALGLLRSFFLDASRLLDDPAAPPGWAHTDPAMLQALGRSSRTNVTSIAALAARRPAMQAAIAGGTAFLDVGTGVGQVAMAAVEQWPHLHAVGVDLWQPSLALAQANVAACSLAHQVELRCQDVLHLPDRDRFALAWLPTPFIGRDTVDRAIPALLGTLMPGGWLVAGLFAIPADPLAAAVTRLRIARSGGHPWTAPEVAAAMEQAGYTDVEIPPTTGMVRIIGRRPDR